MAPFRRCCGRDGAASVSSCKYGRLLAGVGLPDLCRLGFDFDDDLPDEKRSRPTQTSIQRWTVSGEENSTEDRHDACLNRIHRHTDCVCSRLSLRMVPRRTLFDRGRSCASSARLLCCFLVTKENTFASAKVELSQDQKVISTGPYAVVRHPMYSGLALSFFGTPLALGSHWGLLASALMAIGFIWRLYDEEKFLVENLRGYAEYRRQVRWRLIPGIF